MRVWAPENPTSAFRKTGIYPVNKDMTADSDIAQSLVYNQYDDINPSSSHPHTASLTEPHCLHEEAKDSKNSNNSTCFASRTTISVLSENEWPKTSNGDRTETLQMKKTDVCVVIGSQKSFKTIQVLLM